MSYFQKMKIWHSFYFYIDLEFTLGSNISGEGLSMVERLNNKI